ncbi:MAG: hypothetical protein ABFS09_04990 [Thermodesulfobacteriota bacterium]
MEFDHAAILAALPHRPPFLFLDKVIDITPGQKGTGIKRLSADELLLAANKMVMPNILHLEIMAQTTAIICASMPPADQQNVPGETASPGMGYLAGGDLDFTSSAPAIAGDTIEARVEIIKFWSQYILAQGSIFVNDQKLSQGRFTIALAEGY